MFNRVSFEVDRCKGCGLCIIACPKKLIAVTGKINIQGYEYVAVEDQSKCTSCGSCYRICPDQVITIGKEVG